MPKSSKKTRPSRTGHYWLRWLQPNFECGAFDYSPILETPALIRSSGARHLLCRRSPVGEAEFVFGPITPRSTFHTGKDRPLLSIGGRQDRGVRSWRGPKLTGIRQAKSRRRIRIIKHNQWFAGVVNGRRPPNFASARLAHRVPIANLAQAAIIGRRCSVSFER
jgi:hypothetical protein